MGKATTQIETRLTGNDQTAGAFASLKRRFNEIDKNSVFNRDLNPFKGLAKSNFAKGIGAGLSDVSKMGGGLSKLAEAPVRLASGVARAALGVTALGAAIAGIGAAKGLHTALAMDELGDAAQRAGLTVNAYKGFTRVMDQMGLQGRELAGSVFPKMNKALGEEAGQKALARIGLSFEAIKAMSPDERFKAIGAAIADVGNDLDRVQLAADLFGRAGIELDAVFRQGGKAFRESFDVVGQLAGQLDEEGVAAAGRFSEAWKITGDRIGSVWQNLVGGMLKGFESRFGRIDVWMLGMWEDFAAQARIVWLEVSTNGPAVFHTFFRNAERLATAFFSNWREGFAWLWDSIIGAATGLAMGFARLGKAIWASLKGDEADWKGVTNAFEAAVPDFKDLAGRLGVELEKTQLVDLSAEKEKIREQARQRKLADAEALEAADRMQRQTSDNLSGGLRRGALALKDALKDAEAVSTGSYEAFKLRAGGLRATLQEPIGPSYASASMDRGAMAADSNPMASALAAMVSLLRDGNRDRVLIRDSVEALGVA